jgi:cysteine desulfurase/selenocysteine lyase
MKAAVDQQVSLAPSIEDIRAQFPILHQQVNGKQLIYFDNAATTQKPSVVVEAISNYYNQYNANIHRGIHALAEKATAAYEETRLEIQKFLNAPEAEEIIFTSGTTSGINLVSNGYGRKFLQPGDEVLISEMEHHANIVPWQMICQEKGARLKVVPIDDEGNLMMDAFQKLLTKKTRIVAINHISNTLGTINPVKEIVRMSHSAGAVVLLDGAQAVAHIDVDVQDLGCDFYVFSAHKLFGPTGVGVLYGKRALLESMEPFQGGGEMIAEVTFEKTTYNEIPHKFEAGTPNIADVIATKTAIQFVDSLGSKDLLWEHEQHLLRSATEQLAAIPGLKLIGTAKEKIGVVSFVLEGMHHFDIGMMLDARGIAVRTGHHCTQPLMQRYGIEGTVRASFSVYNTLNEVTIFAENLEQITAKWR